MFAPDTPMTLTDVTFTTEVEDEETRRVVVCKFAIAPFTLAMADDLNIRTVLFDTSGLLKEAIETVVANISVPDQRLTFAMSPDQGDRRVVLPNVEVVEKLKAKIKRDRDPVVCEAVLKLRFLYPTADQLLYIANGVNETHYLTFEPEQLDLLTSAEDDQEPIRRRPTGHGATAH